MKVLFVCSGNNTKFGIIPFIREQASSLIEQGINVEFFTIKGKGVFRYLTAVKELRSHLKTNSYDLIHAHFTHSGWVSVLASYKLPIILSLMGSDAYGEYIGVQKISSLSVINKLLTQLIQPFVAGIISKSENIERYVYLKHKSFIIPNGVDTNKFYPYTVRPTLSTLLPDKLSPTEQKITILFLSDPLNLRKNFNLARMAVDLLESSEIILVAPYPVPHHIIPDLLNAADVLVVTSLMEGSPNLVKEGMACNCPIVSTDMGDVRYVFGNTEGCYLADFNEQDFSEKLRAAIQFAITKGRTNGFERIQELGLTSGTIATKLITIYRSKISSNISIEPQELATDICPN